MLFVLTTFLSAFLLFQVQPLISRYILPWFGGTSAVWSTSLLFFQSLLLAGYAYAHALSSGPSRRRIVHLALLAGSVIILLACAWRWGSPLLPDSAWKPPDAGQPFIRIVILLSASVGLPYFLLSSTSPLVQSWLGILSPGRTPYRLYVVSNLGSFLGLISYPLVFEPLLGLHQQSVLWSGAYLVYAVLGAVLAIKVFSARRRDRLPAEDAPLSPAPSPADRPAPPLARKLAWVAFPAVASILLLSITNQLTQEVAVIPFLWVLPLSLYLLSFMITFSGERWYRSTSNLLLLAIATLLLSYAVASFASLGAFTLILIFSFYLFMACLVCHGELYRLRPAPHLLTNFYLLVSLGGALGGLFVNLGAPLIFRGYWELQVGALLCWLLVLILLIADRGSIFHRRWVWVVAPLLVATVGVAGYTFYAQAKITVSDVLEMQRNFYGVFRVRPITAGEPPAEAVSLNHGITAHGFQFTQPEKRRVPTAYYGKMSGIGLAIDHFSELLPGGSSPAAAIERGLRVGVIGLGAGTLAAYGKSGDYYRFYEINPDIIDLARGKNDYFTYLEDSPAAIDVVPGDARLSLEEELARGQPQDFDILAVDAFSSDSIPVHLLTREAFSVYLRHLDPEGVLAVHISNRYLDLAPLVRLLADYYGLSHALVASPRNDDGSYAAVWVLLSKNQAFFRLPDIAQRKKEIPDPDPRIRLWSDDYSNLLPFVRMNRVFNYR